MCAVLVYRLLCSALFGCLRRRQTTMWPSRLIVLRNGPRDEPVNLKSSSFAIDLCLLWCLWGVWCVYALDCMCLCHLRWHYWWWGFLSNPWSHYVMFSTSAYLLDMNISTQTRKQCINIRCRIKTEADIAIWSKLDCTNAGVFWTFMGWDTWLLKESSNWHITSLKCPFHCKNNTFLPQSLSIWQNVGDENHREKNFRSRGLIHSVECSKSNMDTTGHIDGVETLLRVTWIIGHS